MSDSGEQVRMKVAMFLLGALLGVPAIAVGWWLAQNVPLALLFGGAALLAWWLKGE